MKKLFVLFILVAFATAAMAITPADSTKASVAKVKELSKKEYTVIANGDTLTVTPGDTINQVTFAVSDSAKATGKVDYQNINGKKTKVKQITAHGKTSWVKDDQDLSKPITMWCDEDDDTSDPIASGWYGLMGLIVLAGGFAFWKYVFRG